MSTSQPAKRPAHRPSSYTPEIGERICQLIEDGLSIREIVAIEWTPGWETMRRWLNDFPDFRARYARAREVSAEAFEDRILTVAASATDKDSAAAARVEVDALKWVASKRNPRVYGDKLDLHVSTDVGSALERMRARRGHVIDAE